MKIVLFPNAKPRLLESPPPPPAMTHGIGMPFTDDDIENWKRLTSDGYVPMAKWSLEILRKAATQPAARKMRGNALPPTYRVHFPIMFTEADDKAFREQAKACGVPVEIWAREALKAALA